MIQVDVTLKGSVVAGSKDKALESRRSWSYTDFPHPVRFESDADRESFLQHLRLNINISIDTLGCDNVYGYIITRILDIKQVYPV